MIVKSYGTIDECLRYINAHPAPLGLYYFGKDRAEKEHVLEGTLSGGVTVNEGVELSDLEPKTALETTIHERHASRFPRIRKTGSQSDR